jgi:aerobic carbon-monoxide dehydrogenase large subunit
MTGAHIGRSLRRLEDERFLTGRGRYADDLAVPGQLHGVVLRSPHGHAVIEGIDAEAARAMPGVAGVFTAVDLDVDGIGTLPCIAQVATVAPIIVPPRRALARDRVRHVGDPVAFVVADTVHQARDAAELVAVVYRPLPTVVDAREALATQVPLLWDEAPGNLSYRFERGDKSAVEAAFAAAAHIVEIELVNNRLVVAPIEPRVAIGTYDAATDRFDLVLSGQGVHGLRRQLAAAVFNMPPDSITLRAPDVGGGFGVKNFLYREWVLVLWAARRLGRPVRWLAERGEEFISCAQGRDNHTRARLALDRDGRFLALDVDTVANLGAYLSTNGPGSSTNSPASAMGGVYDIPAVFMAVCGVFTNTLPIDAYRGAGKPEANYLIERLADRAARRLALDPIELRRRNLISRFPYKSGLGVMIDCGRCAANLDEMAQRVLADGFAARRQAAAERGRLRGLGIACFLETSRGTPGERAEIRFEPDGRVALVLGTQSNGQGHETSFAQIAADLLGLPIAAFRFVQADTRTVKSGNGHGGARSMHMGGTALYLAAQMVLSKARVIAAHLLQADASEVNSSAGRFTVGGSERGIGLLELAEAARDPANLPANWPWGMTPGLDADAHNDSDVFTFPNGCHTAEIEIDPETGAVTLERYHAIDDYGRLINPMLTMGQVQGGVAQGIGQALLEHTVYDRESGQLLSGSFLDYALPRADDLPPLDITLVELPTLVNALGVKGAGQAGCMAAPQTIINAILDALAPLGIVHIDMPATPERVWRAVCSARRLIDSG